MWSGCAFSPKTTSVPQDLLRFPQKFEPYADSYVSNSLLEQTKVFEEHWFAPWHYTTAPQSLDAILWPYLVYQKGEIFGPLLQILDAKWFEEMYQASDFASFDTLHAYGLSIRTCDLKNFPTHDPLFRDPTQAGEGFPFDYNQNSGVHANEPLYLSHYARDRDWIYVFTSYASGWLHVSNVALPGTAQIKHWESLPKFYITQEDYPLHDPDGRYLTHTKIGTVLPYIPEASSMEWVEILTAQRESDGSARFIHAKAPHLIGSRQALPMRATHIAAIGNQLLQEEYGWGGLLERRDCSSLLRDYFAVFGIWLPRNSAQQAKIGRVISLKGLEDQEKLERIRREAIPFETLIFKPGHIMLYLGIYDEEVAVFHDTWAVRTRLGSQSGRHLIGKSVISSLRLGRDLEDYDPNGALLLNIESFNILTLKPEGQSAIQATHPQF